MLILFSDAECVLLFIQKLFRRKQKNSSLQVTPLNSALYFILILGSGYINNQEEYGENQLKYASQLNKK